MLTVGKLKQILQNLPDNAIIINWDTDYYQWESFDEDYVQLANSGDTFDAMDDLRITDKNVQFVRLSRGM